MHSFRVPPLPEGWTKQMTIKDPVRKKNVMLSPEEWVRQHVMRYFHEFLGYPLSLMSVERGLKFNSLSKRADLVIYLGHTPFILVECKAQNQKLDSVAWLQTASYQHELKAHYFVLTNGFQHFMAFRNPENQIVEPFFNALPHYNSLK